MSQLTPHSPSADFERLSEEQFAALPEEAVCGDGIRVVRLKDGVVLKLCRASRRRASVQRRLRSEATPNHPVDLLKQQQPIGPTPERLAKGAWVESENGYESKVSRPLYVDTLRARKLLSREQHHFCLQFISLWYRAGRPQYKVTFLQEAGKGSTANGTEAGVVEQLTGQNEYFKLISMLTNRNYRLVYDVCIEEDGIFAAALRCGIPRKHAMVYFRQAMDELGSALEQMDEIKKQYEDAKNSLVGTATR